MCQTKSHKKMFTLNISLLHLIEFDWYWLDAVLCCDSHTIYMRFAIKVTNLHCLQIIPLKKMCSWWCSITPSSQMTPFQWIANIHLVLSVIVLNFVLAKVCQMLFAARKTSIWRFTFYNRKLFRQSWCKVYAVVCSCISVTEWQWFFIECEKRQQTSNMAFCHGIFNS